MRAVAFGLQSDRGENAVGHPGPAAFFCGKFCQVRPIRRRKAGGRSKTHRRDKKLVPSGGEKQAGGPERTGGTTNQCRTWKIANEKSKK